MIVCPKLVFLHLHKSGGTFVNKMLLECIPYAKQIGYHLPYRELPPTFKRLPVLGTVRNPWAYYVSWFSFQSQIDDQNALFRIVSEDAILSFEQTIENLVSLPENEDMRNKLADSLHTSYQPNGLNLLRGDVDQMMPENGFYTFLFRRMYEGANSPTIMKSETLRQSLSAYLEKTDDFHFKRAAPYLAEAPNANTSTHSSYQDYYTPSLRALIEDKDRQIIHNFNYHF